MQMIMFKKQGLILASHDQTGWNDEIKDSYGYVEIGQQGVYATKDKTENISFLISCTDKEFLLAQAKNSGTKAFHMMPFFH